MKNFLTVLILLIATACVTLFGSYIYIGYQDKLPENKIIGVWRGDRETSEMRFDKDSVYLVVSDVSATGTYGIDAEKSELTIKYTLHDIKYERTFIYSFEPGKLFLKDKNVGIQYIFSKL